MYPVQLDAPGHAAVWIVMVTGTPRATVTTDGSNSRKASDVQGALDLHAAVEHVLSLFYEAVEEDQKSEADRAWHIEGIPRSIHDPDTAAKQARLAAEANLVHAWNVLVRGARGADDEVSLRPR